MFVYLSYDVINKSFPNILSRMFADRSVGQMLYSGDAVKRAVYTSLSTRSRHNGQSVWHSRCGSFPPPAWRFPSPTKPHSIYWESVFTKQTWWTTNNKQYKRNQTIIAQTKNTRSSLQI